MNIDELWWTIFLEFIFKDVCILPDGALDRVSSFCAPLPGRHLDAKLQARDATVASLSRWALPYWDWCRWALWLAQVGEVWALQQEVPTGPVPSHLHGTFLASGSSHLKHCFSIASAVTGLFLPITALEKNQYPHQAGKALCCPFRASEVWVSSLKPTTAWMVTRIWMLFLSGRSKKLCAGVWFHD